MEKERESKDSKKPTLFEDQIDEVFLKGFKKGKRPETTKKYAGNYFWLLSTSKKPSYYKYYFELHDNFVFCRKGENQDEIAYMDIFNCFVRITEGTMINEEKHFGIKFIKKKTYEELFTKDEDVIHEWYELLKKFCILTKFRLFYETKKVIGKGNFAKVFLVERKSDQKEYAAKVFSKNAIMGDPVEKLCLIYEIKMLRTMNHHRVIRLHELYEGENFVYCLVDLFKGSDLLNAIIKKGFQPEAKALTIVYQILEAVHYMHSLGIMHRDLKPENVIFRDSKEGIDIGVVDLGFATYESDYKKLFIRCGTPGYVAPEVLKDRNYDCRVDVYSTGIILYIMWVN